MKLSFVGILVALFSIILSFSRAQAPAAADADMVLYNGKVITVDSLDHIYQAIALKDGKVLKVGTDVEIKSLAGSRCKMIDLKGKTVTPGLIDSHYHVMYYGAQFWPGYLNIRAPLANSKASLLKIVGDHAKTLSPGVWISGNQGFALQMYETVDRWALDSVAPKNPVYLRHCSGQYSVVNSLALDSAGITSSTPNPPGSRIMHDSLGRPNGILSHYPAENLVGKHATGYGDRTLQQKLEDIEVGQSQFFQAGYTSGQDVIVGSREDIYAYRQFADSGRLKIRLYALLFIDTEQEVDSLIKVMKPFTAGRFRFAGWKLAQDGGPGARTCLMYDSTLYAAGLSYPYHTQDTLNRIITKLHNTGMQVSVHVTGDRGIDMTLTAFEEALRTYPRADPRHRIEHGQFPRASALTRMKSSNIIYSAQPQWIPWYSDGYLAGTDTATMARLLPLKTALDLGIHIAFGCDVPASTYQEPKYAFLGACVRRSSSGMAVNLGEKLTAKEALRIHTMGSAYASFSDSTTGSLEVGKYADLVIWSQDLYTMSPTMWNDLAAQMTIVNGEIVFDDGSNVVTTGISDQQGDGLPRECALSQSYPNPFNSTSDIRYQVSDIRHVMLVVYDLLGREVAVLVNERKEPGSYTVTWDASSMASGTYVYRIQAGSFIQSRKMILMR
jgi:predicted amidohydrolase YtcJ